MFFRGPPIIPNNRCRDCHGSGSIKMEGLLPYECDRCNGTGIEGDPALGFLLIVVSVLLTVIPLAYCAAQ